MKANWRVLVFMVVAVVAAILWYLSLPYCYVASCELAFSTSNIVTNEYGLVIMAGDNMRKRHYSDHRRNLRMRIDDCLGDGNRRLTMCDEYLKLHPECLDSAAIVSNAFSFVRFEVAGSEDVATAEITFRAEDRDVALGISAYAAERLGRFIDEENLIRQDKALSALRSQILGAQRRNEDATELMKNFEAAKLFLDSHRERILLLKVPYVKYACRLPRGMML